jgi:phage terminase large subunit-like protein
MDKRKIGTDNYIYAYYQQIKDGSVTVGRWVTLLYEYLIQSLEKGSFLFDQKKANSAIEWIESRCFHTEGELAPNCFRLELWQKAFVSAVFGIVDENGRRHFREVVLIVGRKNGKSLLASAIARYMWLCEGGFGARVYCIAPKLDQADIIYNCIWAMTQIDPEWKSLKMACEDSRAQKKKGIDDSELARHRMTDLMLPATNSTVKKIAFSSKKSDGFNPSLTICDEVASWEGDKGLKQYEVMKSGMGARPEGLMLSCSTAGYINESIFDELMKRSTRFLLGDSKETRLLPFLYMIDDVDKWNDINELRKANPNLGVSISVDYLLEEIAIAEGSLSKKAEFITKYCNIKQNSSQAWLSTKVIEKACDGTFTLDDFRHSYAIVGLDLSQTTDLTACTTVIEKNGELYVFCKFWLPSEKIQEASERDQLPYNQYITKGWLEPSGENFVDYHDCERYLQSLVEEYEILPLCVGYDRFSASYLISALKDYGFNCDDVYQGTNLYPMTQQVEGLLKDGKIHIGENDLMKVHMLNSAIKMDVERGRGRLVKIHPNAHIDGMAALLDAFAVRDKHYGDLKDRLQN